MRGEGHESGQRIELKEGDTRGHIGRSPFPIQALNAHLKLDHELITRACFSEAAASRPAAGTRQDEG